MPIYEAETIDCKDEVTENKTLRTWNHKVKV